MMSLRSCPSLPKSVLYIQILGTLMATGCKYMNILNTFPNLKSQMLGAGSPEAVLHPVSRVKSIGFWRGSRK